MGITITGGLSFSGGLTVVSPPTGATGSSWIAYMADSGNTNLLLDKMVVDASGNIYTTGKSQSGSLCVMLKHNTEGVLQWQRQFTGISEINGPAISNGDPAFVGYNYNNVADIALGLMNSAGTMQWSRNLTSANYEIAANRGCATDSSGNIFILGAAASSGFSDYNMLVAKYNSSGVIQWQRSLGQVSPSNSEYPNWCAVDSSGAFLIGGSARISAFDASLGFLAKIDSAGNLLWQRYLGTSAGGGFRGINVDSSGNIYTVSQTSQTATVAKWNSSGTLQWQRYMTNNITIDGQAVTADSAGNVYFTGYTTLTGYSPIYTVVVKWNSSGTLQWQRYIGITGTIQFTGADIAVDTVGNYYVLNQYYPSNYPTGVAKSLITKLPTDGTRTGTYSVGGINVTYGSIGFTEGAGSLSSGAPSFPFTTSSYTDSAGNLAVSTSNTTSTTTTIASS